MNWTRRHTLAAGLGLIVLTNAVALVGVVYNRSREEATLRLSERELRAPYRWYGDRENSGLDLAIVWRVPVERTGANVWRYLPTGGGAPAWLDAAKMQALGFDAPAGDSREGRRRYDKQLPREVLLVLELDGPAYRRSLELAAEYAAGAEAKLAANPAEKEFAARAKNAREALEWETNRNSRLFAVDAGLDRDALRAKYPDRTRYAIARGEVRPEYVEVKSGKFAGYLGALSVASVNVPLAFRGVFGDAPKAYEPDDRKRAPFEATVAYGKRLEPWIVGAAKK
jgi:hypothetical protein